MRVELNDEQVAERGRELATLLHNLYEARESKKESAKAYAETIAEFEKRIAALSQVVRSGIEYRDDQQQLFEREFENDRESLADHLERELQAHPIDGITEVSVGRAGGGGRRREIFKAKGSSG